MLHVLYMGTHTWWSGGAGHESTYIHTYMCTPTYTHPPLNAASYIYIDTPIYTHPPLSTPPPGGQAPPPLLRILRTCSSSCASATAGVSLWLFDVVGVDVCEWMDGAYGCRVWALKRHIQPPLNRSHIYTNTRTHPPFPFPNAASNPPTALAGFGGSFSSSAAAASVVTGTPLGCEPAGAAAAAHPPPPCRRLPKHWVGIVYHLGCAQHVK